MNDAQSIGVLTGVGISAESGIPTFQEIQSGFWSQYNPEELATLRAFQTNPELVWDWYWWRRELIAKSGPNPGHEALSELEKILTQQSRDFTLITQNVDGLHHLAGNKNVIELHGNIMQVKCFRCNQVFANDPSTKEGSIPHCVFCSGLLRPNVVWFGESLPKKSLEMAWNAAQNCDIFFSVGTSGIVQPTASLPLVALQNSATLVEINPNPTTLTSLVTFSIQGNAGTILPNIIKQMNLK